MNESQKLNEAEDSQQQEIKLTDNQRKELQDRLKNQKSPSKGHFDAIGGDEQVNQEQLEKAETLLKGELYSIWQFAAICQFFFIYKDAFGIEEFDVQVTLLFKYYFGITLFCLRRNWNLAFYTLMIIFGFKNCNVGLLSRCP